MVKVGTKSSYAWLLVVALSVTQMVVTGSCFAASAKVDFSREILPILSDKCFYCHGPDSSHRKAKLRLDDEKDAKRDRKGEAVIVPGSAEKSLLVARITASDEDDRMPPLDSHKKLSPQQIETLKRWINEGAHWGEHWSFAKIHRPEVPKIKASGLVRNPIDAFVIAHLDHEGLKPSPQADKRTLIRRVTLDLTGLPPTPAEVDAFLKDSSSNAFEKVVDRLLASPAYGERMAWDWMEVARYADSNGYQGDADRTMWPWRDWVIKAFNSNMPYDQFTIEQLAGDLLTNSTPDEKLATAFCRNHPINGEGGRIAEENRVDYVMDMTETTATTWLGLTFTCTRCHDHKFDPLTRRDYYGMFAFFNQTPVTGGGGNPQTAPVLETATEDQSVRLAELKKTVRKMAADLKKEEKRLFPQAYGTNVSTSATNKELSAEIKAALKKDPAQRKTGFEILEKEFGKTQPTYVSRLHKLQDAIKARDDYSKVVPRVMVMENAKTSRKTYILEKGLYNKVGEEVTAATPARLPAMPADAPRNRLGLAQWIVSSENPLTARVTANRVWQMFFGVGIVKTSEDFGVQGELPVNPELLDWLAAEFEGSRWDLKKLIRLIVTSNTYRQSSKVTKELHERDPDNRLLARGPRFRMPSWMLRDQALAASGLMSHKIGGAPVKTYQPDGVWEEATFGVRKYKQDEGDALYRRSLYIFWRRIIGPTELFDTPSRMTCTVKPTRNNTPLHALTTLNDTTYVEAARTLAEHVMVATSDSRKRAELAYNYVLARPPSSNEQKILLAEFERAKSQFALNTEDTKQFLAVGESKRNEKLDPVEHAAWTATCLAILNLDEALTKE